MSEFKVGDKVIAISKSTGDNFDTCKHARKIESGIQKNLYVVGFFGNIIIVNSSKEFGSIGSYYLEVDLIKFNKKNEKIKKLKSEVAELKLIVNQLRKPSTVIGELVATSQSSVDDKIEYEGQQYQKVDREAREGDVVISNVPSTSFVTKGKPYKVTFNFDDLIVNGGTPKTVALYNVGRTPETVDVYELIQPSTTVEDKPFATNHKGEPLTVEQVTTALSQPTPNQLRAEIIEKAKLFVEESRVDVEAINLNGPNKGKFEVLKSVYSVFTDEYTQTACEAEFKVIDDKKKVICLLKGINTGKVYHKGIAKCQPTDAFNKHIGKAIALGRALGIDVSEFEDAVKPDEFAQGMEVRLTENLTHPNNKKGSIRVVCPPGEHYKHGGYEAAIDSLLVQRSVIYNDTNAIYKEVN